jgi:hypothetical protein
VIDHCCAPPPICPRACWTDWIAWDREASGAASTEVDDPDIGDADDIDEDEGEDESEDALCCDIPWGSPDLSEDCPVIA